MSDKDIQKAKLEMEKEGKILQDISADADGNIF